MSVRYTAADVAQWCGGEVVSGSPDTELLGLAIDTREVTPGCLFAAIVGPNHDAHKFLAQAKDAGASGLLVQTDSDVDLTAFADIAVIGVADTTKGIGDLATGHRGRFAGTVIALTGSCG
ncbi:MAG: UDP-N-acetylmuramoyl-tripeptide--D-alanyl-D-alanine ligase, partial [bacterium]